MATSLNIEVPAQPGLSSGFSFRNWYSLLFLAGFVMRFDFVRSARTYDGSANTMTSFGAEVCRIAAHIAAGKGFRAPFNEIGINRRDRSGPPGVATVAAVFHLFGAYSKGSALILLGLECAMGTATGLAIWALRARSLRERIGFWAAWIWALSPIFFRRPCSWIWYFAASGLLLATALVLSLDAGETGARAKWLWLGALWGLIGLTNPVLLSVMPFSFLHLFFANRKTNAQRLQGNRNLIYALITFAVIASPLVIRNEIVFKRRIFLRDNYWFEFSLGNYHYRNGMGYMGKHPDGNPRFYNQVAQMGELGSIAYHKKDAFDFLRQDPREFVDLALHRSWWFWDGTPLPYHGREWWSPWDFWPLSAVAWLGMLFVLTRHPPGWLLFSAALIVYPIPHHLAYLNAPYRYAIEPEMLLLGGYLVSVLWSEIAAHRLSPQGNRSRFPCRFI
jgi:hypothetical protein